MTSGEGARPRELGAATIATPLGPLLALADHRALWLLTFLDPPETPETPRPAAAAAGLGDVALVPGHTPITVRLEAELERYFEGGLREFTVPVALRGTPFQREAWSALREIPFGETRSYGQQAAAMGRSSAVRAVGRANGANRIPIIIPCHRVIGADGSLTGYGAGVWRKERLLALERQVGPGGVAR